MLDQKQFNRISLAMPILQQADETLINELKNKVQLMKIPAGHDFMVYVFQFISSPALMPERR